MNGLTFGQEPITFCYDPGLISVPGGRGSALSDCFLVAKIAILYLRQGYWTYSSRFNAVYYITYIRIRRPVIHHEELNLRPIKIIHLSTFAYRNSNILMNLVLF